jgi:hypothetical protein
MHCRLPNPWSALASACSELHNAARTQKPSVLIDAEFGERSAIRADANRVNLRVQSCR